MTDREFLDDLLARYGRAARISEVDLADRRRLRAIFERVDSSLHGLWPNLGAAADFILEDLAYASRLHKVIDELRRARAAAVKARLTK